MRISDWSSDVCSSDLRQARQAVRRALRERPGVDVVVTGCAAELEAERFRGLGARVVANDAKGLAESYRLEEKNGASPGLDPGSARTDFNDGAIHSPFGLSVSKPRPSYQLALSGADHARAFLCVQTPRRSVV